MGHVRPGSSRLDQDAATTAMLGSSAQGGACLQCERPSSTSPESGANRQKAWPAGRGSVGGSGIVFAKCLFYLAYNLNFAAW